MECICQWSNCNMVSKVMEFHIIAEVLQTSTKILCNKPDEHWDGWPFACRYTIYNPGTCNSHPRKLSLIINQICNEYWWRSSCSLLSPRLWNQLHASFHQLRTNLSNSDSLNPLSGTSSIGSIDSPLSSSINPSLLHSRLKNFPFLHILPTVKYSPLSSSINPSLLHSRLKNFPFLHILPTVKYKFCIVLLVTCCLWFNYVCVDTAEW